MYIKTNSKQTKETKADKKTGIARYESNEIERERDSPF